MKIKNLKPIILVSLLAIPVISYGDTQYKLNKKAKASITFAFV